MKNILIAIIFVLIACISAKQVPSSEENKKYKPYSEFKGDTIKYLTYNFIDGKSKYIGKPFNSLLNDLEFEIKSYTEHSLSRDIAHTDAINAYFYDFDTHVARSETHEYVLSFEFEQLVSMDSVENLNQNKNQEWSEKHQKFFGKQIVKDIHLVIMPDPRLKKK